MSRNPETENLLETELLVSPQNLRRDFPLSDALRSSVQRHRMEVKDILRGRDRRLLLIVGPCSIHNPASALRYAEKLRELSARVSDRIKILMRVYFEKPRTTTGWKGLIYDPELNGEYNIAAGISCARKLMREIAAMDLPVAAELLDPITGAYLTDMMSWAGIGARTTESQPHRQYVSGLPMAVGFKNGTDGNINVAIDAVIAAGAPHNFIGMLENGHCGIFRTAGNNFCHPVLRGGAAGGNFDAAGISAGLALLDRAGLDKVRLVVDCSHGNSGKDYTRQGGVLHDVLRLRCQGETRIAGAMLESFLSAGSQKLLPGRAPDPDISITDGCLSFAETAELITAGYALLPGKS